MLFKELFESLSGWEISEIHENIVILLHPAGRTMTVWLDSSDRVILTLPGKFNDPHLPVIFRRK